MYLNVLHVCQCPFKPLLWGFVDLKLHHILYVLGFEVKERIFLTLTHISKPIPLLSCL